MKVKYTKYWIHPVPGSNVFKPAHYKVESYYDIEGTNVSYHFSNGKLVVHGIQAVPNSVALEDATLDIPDTSGARILELHALQEQCRVIAESLSLDTTIHPAKYIMKANDCPFSTTTGLHG